MPLSSDLSPRHPSAHGWVLLRVLGGNIRGAARVCPTGFGQEQQGTVARPGDRCAPDELTERERVARSWRSSNWRPATKAAIPCRCRSGSRHGRGSQGLANLRLHPRRLERASRRGRKEPLRRLLRRPMLLAKSRARRSTARTRVPTAVRAAGGALRTEAGARRPEHP
jgi:hypothetical protein